MKKGFTLIELLAVIVILAIIALIASPIIIGLIDDARKESFKSSAYGIVKAGEILYSKDMMNNTKEEVVFTYNNGEETSSVDNKQLEYNGAKPDSGNVFINEDGKIAIIIYNGTYCAEKGYDESEIRITSKSKEECKITLPFECGNTLFDSRDGLSYTTIEIGEQCWMAENLKYTGNGCAGKTWNATAPHDACQSHSTDWGEEVLYQWEAAMNWDGVTPSNPEELERTQGLCPDGWHIPTDEEWTILTSFVVENAGTKLKAITPTWDGNDTVGFNAKPAGYRSSGGSLFFVGSFGYWWSSSISGSNAWYRSLYSGDSGVGRGSISQAVGSSVRCLLGQ